LVRPRLVVVEEEIGQHADYRGETWGTRRHATILRLGSRTGVSRASAVTIRREPRSGGFDGGFWGGPVPQEQCRQT
jgi:hypothetical protein